MNEEVKDPNQLDLFAGILFTPEQEKMIAEYIERCKTSVKSQESKNNQIEVLLVANGFVLGKDFENDFEKYTITKEVQLGSSWNKNIFNVKITYETCSGGIALLAVKHNNGNIEKRKFIVDESKGKLQCASIQDQYRYIKPSTLLEKLHQHNELQEIYCENFNKRSNVKQYTTEKYQKLYPNATVSIVTEYTRSTGTFELIQIKFPSGSYIQLYIPSEIDKESIYKKVDAELSKLGIEEVLEKFNKQEALN